MATGSVRSEWGDGDDERAGPRALPSYLAVAGNQPAPAGGSEVDRVVGHSRPLYLAGSRRQPAVPLWGKRGTKESHRDK